LHANSPRADKAFVVVDCGAIAPGLVASELFGHKRGAFTSAHEDRVGAFESARGGTLFLDEIGELPLELQPALLRVLETRQVTRVGESHARHVDVRVVAATNRKLKADVDAGRFRADLFFRLAVVSVTLPPLRERKDEVLTLAGEFLKEQGRNLDDVEAADRAQLLGYSWPGNVRELRNVVLRSCALTGLDERVKLAFDDDETPAKVTTLRPVAPGVDLLKQTLPEARRVALDELDARYLAAVLEACDGNVSAAARRAGVARSYFHRLLAKHRPARRKRSAL
jgi:transcriptional regulator with GAF, ATPase, and Fis domain